MKRKLINFIAMVLLLCSTAGLTACNNNKIVETEYFRIELDKKKGYAIALDLTEKGKEQEILIVPMFVKNLPVKQIGGRLKILGGGTTIESKQLKKLYIPHTVENIINAIFAYEYRNENSEIVVNLIETPPAYYNFVSVSECAIIHISDVFFILDTFRPNTFFMYNYLGSPNQGYYSYDYITGSNLYMLPPTPVRENYDFAGWYLEPELITLWNEETPQSPDETLELYAKWQAK